jgi:glycosyltransferase involved in cell wall biosynthesis
MIGILSTKKVDLVYFTMSPSGGAFYRDILFLGIIKLFRKKRLLHFRVKGIRKTASSLVGRALVKFAFKNTDIVCLSHHHMEDIAGLAYRTPYIVPNGIKVETEFLYLADEYSYTPGAPVKILFLSNLSIKKGIPELIDALSILKCRGYDFNCSLVGSEWDMSFSDVKQLISKAGLENNVMIEGPKYGKEKFTYIARCDVFVFPTYFELFPGVILEAMMFGKAIVSTFEGSIPEMITNNVNGLLVEQRNADQLADAVAFLIDNPGKREEIAALAKKKFFEDFTLTAFEHKMKTVYEDVIRK